MEVIGGCLRSVVAFIVHSVIGEVVGKHVFKSRRIPSKETSLHGQLSVEDCVSGSY